MSTNPVILHSKAPHFRSGDREPATELRFGIGDVTQLVVEDLERAA
jgi:hypothetical protein